eukprot:1121550-Amorphochlora_amoeboformis.AAC.1
MEALARQISSITGMTWKVVSVNILHHHARMSVWPDSSTALWMMGMLVRFRGSVIYECLRGP